MKIRKFSVLVVLLLILSLAPGCGETAKIPALADCGVVDGMLMHSGHYSDFTAVTGNILMYQYGHVHVERMTEDTECGLWRVATSSANIAQLSGNTKE